MERRYIGARYVPKFFEGEGASNEWVSYIPYEELTIVTHEGVRYISKRPVPANVPLNNSTYWMVYSVGGAGEGVKLVHLWCDGFAIYRFEDKETPLTFVEVKAIVEDDANIVFITNGYYSIYNKYIYLPSITSTDKKAIGFIGETQLDGEVYSWRIIINEDDEVKEDEIRLAKASDVGGKWVKVAEVATTEVQYRISVPVPPGKEKYFAVINAKIEGATGTYGSQLQIGLNDYYNGILMNRTGGTAFMKGIVEVYDCGYGYLYCYHAPDSSPANSTGATYPNTSKPLPLEVNKIVFTAGNDQYSKFAVGSSVVVYAK